MRVEPVDEGTSTTRVRATNIGAQRATMQAASRDERREEIAREILARLSAEVGHSIVERFFDRQTRIDFHDGHLDVTVPSGFLAQLLDRRFGDQLRRAAAAGRTAGAETSSAATDGQDIDLRFHVDRTAFEAPAAPQRRDSTTRDGQSGNQAPAGQSMQARAGRAAPSRNGRAPKQPGFTPRFRFDDFIVGASNRLAYSAAVRMAEDPQSMAPLFIHGACGMGKTHLLQALARRFKEVHPEANVRYTTAEHFTNEFVTAVMQNKVDQFRKSYRRVDLLCIDDVHFLASKDATQNELLYTFDAVGLDGAKVAMASDEHPREIKKLSEKLASRFMSGMVVKMDAPDAELRGKLVRELAKRRGLELEDAAIQLICDRTARAIGALGGFGGSVREIEGLLIQVDAVHRLLPEFRQPDGRIGLLLVRKALGLQDSDSPSPTDNGFRPRRPISTDTVVAETCKALCVELGDFMGKGRHKRVVLARSITSYLARKLTTQSFPEIARAMGRPNHSTVITAERRLQAQLESGIESFEDVVIPAELAGLSPRGIVDAIAARITKAAGHV